MFIPKYEHCSFYSLQVHLNLFITQFVITQFWIELGSWLDLKWLFKTSFPICILLSIQLVRIADTEIGLDPKKSVIKRFGVISFTAGTDA